IDYLASQAVGGKRVSITNSREDDLITSPVHIGLEATVKLGATKEGKLTLAGFHFLFDTGAYSDMGAGMTKAGAVDCTGPYHIPNVTCDSHCVYTNHPYATSFRGVGHNELTFLIERPMDVLAENLAMDPVELPVLHAVTPVHTTPAQTRRHDRNIGDVTDRLNQLTTAVDWQGKQTEIAAEGQIRTTGIGGCGKTSSTPSNATAGA